MIYTAIMIYLSISFVFAFIIMHDEQWKEICSLYPLPIVLFFVLITASTLWPMQVADWIYMAITGKSMADD